MPTPIAIIRFTADAVPRVIKTFGRFPLTQRPLPGGGLELGVPYDDPELLLKEILTYSGEVEIVAPKDLRAQMKALIEAVIAMYERKK